MLARTPDLDLAAHYTFRVAWSEEDGEFVATAAEFPSLSWLADTQEEAVTGLRVLLADILKDMRERGETPPQPFARHPYSGKILLRITPDLHRRLAVKAAEQDVSINHLLSQLLAEGAA